MVVCETAVQVVLVSRAPAQPTRQRMIRARPDVPMQPVSLRTAARIGLFVGFRDVLPASVGHTVTGLKITTTDGNGALLVLLPNLRRPLMKRTSTPGQ